MISKPKGITKDTLPISDTSPGTKAYLKSLASGARYKLQASSDNRIGRSIPGRGVEIDLSDEQGSEYLHSLHAVARYSTSGWELEIPANTENPVYLNNKKIKPGERVILKSGDRLAFSVTKLIVEIS